MPPKLDARGRRIILSPLCTPLWSCIPLTHAVAAPHQGKLAEIPPHWQSKVVIIKLICISIYLADATIIMIFYALHGQQTGAATAYACMLV